MKINEFKTESLTEGPLWSAVKGAFNKQGSHNTMVQDIFIKDFMNDAVTSINNGIKGGYINTNLRTGQADSEPKQDTTPVPEPTAPTAPAPKAAPTAPVPEPTLSHDQLRAQRVADRGATQARMTRQFGKTVPKNVQAANRMPDDISESRYSKLNAIFESIINEEDDANGISISEFLTDWFAQYMRGVNWSKASQHVNKLIQKFEADYPKNQTKNLKTLASTALALSKLGSPAGAPPQFTHAQKTSTVDTKKLETDMKSLAKSSPGEYEKIIKNLPSPK